jgi:hypothetical protein
VGRSEFELPAFDGICSATSGNFSRGTEKIRGVGEEVGMRRHHEEITVLPALSLLLPFAGALWLRIKMAGRKNRE